MKFIKFIGLFLGLITTQAFSTTLNIQNGADPASLDPHKVSGDWENRIVGDIFEGLMTEAANGEPILGMAEGYTISSDGKKYTFKIKKGMKWSDGTVLNANDFEYAFKRLLNPETASKYAWLQFGIKNAQAYNSGKIKAEEVGVKAIDDLTLEINLENPTPYFLSSLTHYTAYPVPKHLIEKFGSEWVKMENIATNGAYFPVEWIPGSHVKAIINKSWYDVKSLKIDEVIYTVLENESTAYKSFQAGEFDYITGYPTDQFEKIKKETPEVLAVKPFAGLYYYVINSKNENLKDANIRKALSMTINREIITKNILGTGEVPAYSWVPPKMNNYTEVANVKWKSKSYKERVAEAKTILSNKGFSKDKPLEITLRYNTNENHKRVAIAVSTMWKSIGVKVKLYNAETKVHYADLKNNDFEVARAGWLADYNDPINFLALLDSQTGDNYGQWENKEFDDLLKEAAKEIDLKKRALILKQAEQIALDDSAAIPIYYYVTSVLKSTKLKGFEHNVFDIHRTRWLSKEK